MEKSVKMKDFPYGKKKSNQVFDAHIYINIYHTVIGRASLFIAPCTSLYGAVTRTLFG